MQEEKKSTSLYFILSFLLSSFPSFLLLLFSCSLLFLCFGLHVYIYRNSEDNLRFLLQSPHSSAHSLHYTLLAVLVAVLLASSSHFYLHLFYDPPHVFLVVLLAVLLVVLLAVLLVVLLAERAGILHALLLP
eukprot:Phypoly_transcript_17666.p2 GENE.Phypoly_transcript_17666~~Phypoly_transcript_17666.p2  ORF type:complete len:132 (+),score=13.84 Phypoly_transcript_17666:338-733(+)